MPRQELEQAAEALAELAGGKVVVVPVALAPRVRPARFAQATGMTVKAIEKKIEAGKWVQGREYHRDPDGLLWVDVKGAMSWVAPVTG